MAAFCLPEPRGRCKERSTAYQMDLYAFDHICVELMQRLLLAPAVLLVML
jgi:hypothetical protein